MAVLTRPCCLTRRWYRRDGITQNKLISEVTKIAAHDKTVVAKPVNRFPKQSFGSASGGRQNYGGKPQGYDKQQQSTDSYPKQQQQQKKGGNFQQNFRGKGQQSRGGYAKKGVQEFGRYN